MARGGENTKKVAGNAKKAESAAQKKAAEDAKKAEADNAKWSQGSKDNSKAEQAAAKQAEAARKAAEKKALLEEEEASLPSKPGKKPPPKKARGGLDLSGLDAPSSKKDLKALNASNIDDALDALSLSTNDNTGKIDRHPERRFKAAFAAFEERRLEEMKASGEGKGLRRNQMVEQIRREFDKHPDNPFNQANAGRFDLSKEEMAQIKEANKEAVESRLAG